MTFGIFLCVTRGLLSVSGLPVSCCWVRAITAFWVLALLVDVGWVGCLGEREDGAGA